MPNTFSPSDFICQKLDLLESYKVLQDRMNAYYQNTAHQSTNGNDLSSYDQSSAFFRDTLADSLESEPGRLSPDTEGKFSAGEYCACQIRKAWYRCRIVEVSGKVASVECVDDCRKLQVEVGKLVRLRPEFTGLKKFAFRCKLSGLDSKKLLTFNVKAIEKFKNMISMENKELLAEIVEFREEDSYQFYEINLFIDGRDITEWLREVPSD